MKINVTVCDVCKEREEDADGDLPREDLRVILTKNRNTVGSLDLCPGCFQAVRETYERVLHPNVVVDPEESRALYQRIVDAILKDSQPLEESKNTGMDGDGTSEDDASAGDANKGEGSGGPN